MRPPYIPKITSEVDTSNFDKYDEEEPWIPDDKGKPMNRAIKKELNFIGYTYKQDSFVERSPLV